MNDKDVPEDRGRLIANEYGGKESNSDALIDLLRQDFVVLLRNVPPEQADPILHAVTERLGLLNSLKLQAAYATLLGHRQRIGAYRMTVNNRSDYQFIPPHSEGDSFINMQLASFYCLENSTDGGETILLNVDDSSDAWPTLRERATKIARGSRALAGGEMKQATTLYHLHVPAEVLNDDQVLRERASDIPGLRLVDVLTSARRTHSMILKRDVYAYWVSIAIMDRDSLPFYVALLRRDRLLKEPGTVPLEQMDNVAEQRIWSSGVDYSTLFRRKITYKLAPGDLVIQNNLTWAHAVSNWTPGSGVRNVSAAFA